MSHVATIPRNGTYTRNSHGVIVPVQSGSTQPNGFWGNDRPGRTGVPGAPNPVDYPTPTGGGTVPPVSGRYPEEPVPPSTPPTRLPTTPPPYLPGPATNLNPNLPTVDYGDIINRIGGAPDASGTTLSSQDRDRFRQFLDSGGYKVGAADASNDPLTRALMAEARGRASATANRTASDYAAQTGKGSGSAAYATRRGVLSLLGEGSGQREANTLLDERNKYLTSIAEGNATRGLTGYTSGAALENAANQNSTDLYKAAIDAYRANLSGLGLEADLAHKPIEDALAAAANARGNQGAYNESIAAQDARYKQAYDQWIQQQQLDMERQRLADERAREAAQGPLGTGQMHINPDGTISWTLPVAGGGGTGAPTGGSVPAGGGVTVPGGGSRIPPVVYNATAGGLGSGPSSSSLANQRMISYRNSLQSATTALAQAKAALATASTGNMGLVAQRQAQMAYDNAVRDYDAAQQAIKWAGMYGPDPTKWPGSTRTDHQLSNPFNLPAPSPFSLT